MQFAPHLYQQKVLTSDARYVAAIAGVQGGKTMTGVLWLIQEIAKNPYDDFLIAAPTYKILLQSTLKKFFEIFPMYTAKYMKQDSVLKLLPNGGNIYIRSTEIPNNIEGMTLRAAWLDEAGMMKPQVWTNVLGRTAIKKGRVLMTSTPYAVGWLYNEVERQYSAGSADFEVVRWKSIDSPYFPQEEYERAKRTLPTAEFERRYHGEFRKMEGVVYADWKPGDMTFQTSPEEFKEVIAGVDYGYTNPTAITVIGIDKDDKLWIVDELYQSRLTINDIVIEAKELKEKWNISMFYCDPSAPSLIESLNLNNVPTTPANNDVDTGIIKCQQLMKTQRFNVWFGCYNVLDEIENYHYKPLDLSGDKFPEYQKKPDKIYDHLCDSFRYAIATHPIEIFYVEESATQITRSNTFWDRMKKRMDKKQLNISRYGQDYSDEDVEAIQEVYGGWI